MFWAEYRARRVTRATPFCTLNPHMSVNVSTNDQNSSFQGCERARSFTKHDLLPEHQSIFTLDEIDFSTGPRPRLVGASSLIAHPKDDDGLAAEFNAMAALMVRYALLQKAEKGLTRRQANSTPLQHLKTDDRSRDFVIPTIEHGNNQSSLQSQPHSSTTSNLRVLNNLRILESPSMAVPALLSRRFPGTAINESDKVDDFVSLGTSETTILPRISIDLNDDVRASKYFQTEQDIEINRDTSPALWETRFVKYIRTVSQSQDRESMTANDDLGVRAPSSPFSDMAQYTPDLAQDTSDTDMFTGRGCGIIHQDKRKSPPYSGLASHKHVPPVISESSLTAFDISNPSEGWAGLEHSSSYEQRGRVSAIKKQAQGVPLSKDKQYSSDESLDILNLDSKFQRVLSRRLFAQGSRHYKETKQPRTDHLKGSGSRALPLGLEQLPSAPKSTVQRSRQPNTSRSESILISDGSEEEKVTTSKAPNAGSRIIKPPVKRSIKALYPSKDKLAVFNIKNNVKQPQKRSRACVIHITSDSDDDQSDDDESNRDQFQTKRRRIEETLRPGKGKTFTGYSATGKKHSLR